MLIYLDLDNTLIDSVRRHEDEKAVAAEFGISPELYVLCVDELYHRYGKGCYSFRLLYPILCEHVPGLTPQIIETLEQLLLKNYFFLDALPFLSQFRKEDLILLTSGNPEFQQGKIKVHQIEEYVREIIITSDKGSAIKLPLTHPCFFIDDAPKDIESVKRAHPKVICIQVRQPPPWETQKSTEFFDVHLPDLAAVVVYIKGYAGT